LKIIKKSFQSYNLQSKLYYWLFLKKAKLFLEIKIENNK